MRVLRKSTLSIILVASFLFGSVAIIPPVSEGDAGGWPRTLTVHTPIRIDSDADFLTFETGGNGTVWAPWEIENYEINGTGAGSCIYVGNTSEYFEVKNCSLFNANGTYSDPFYANSSVMFQNVSYGNLINCTIVETDVYGVILNYTNNIAISDCNISTNAVWGHPYGGIILKYTNYSIVDNNTINGSAYPFGSIRLYFSKNNTISNNTVISEMQGIRIGSLSNDNQIINNCVITYDAAGGDSGLYVITSENNTLTNNMVRNFRWSAQNSLSNNNSIYHNNFINYTQKSTDDGMNFWDNDYPSGGNYWSDYAGSDDFYGPDQNVAGHDAIGDTNYTIAGGVNADEYPLMAPWTGQQLGYAAAVLPYSIDQGPNGTAVPVDTSFTIIWNETMDWTSVEDAFNYTDGNVIFDSNDGYWTHNDSSNISVFTPAAGLLANTDYDVNVNCSATDLLGNSLDQNQDEDAGEWPDDVLTWTFSTGEAPPTVVSTLPGNAAIGIDPNSTIIIEFSRAMNIVAAQAGFGYSNGTANMTVADGVATWNAAQTIMTFKPTGLLQNNTTYTVILNGGQITALDGMFLDGDGDGSGGDNYTFGFTTWLEAPLPHVINTYPLNGMASVPVNTRINLGFDVQMKTGSVANAFSISNGTNVWDVSAGSVEWFGNGTIFSFIPSVNLLHDSIYTVVVNSTAASTHGRTLDGNNNGTLDVSDDFTFGFMTAPRPPKVVSSSPSDGEAGVPANLGTIILNFSKPMNSISVIDALSISPGVVFNYFWSGLNTNLTILLNGSLAAETSYVLMIGSTAADLDGNRIDGNGDGVGGDEYLLRFSTSGGPDVEGPVIIRVIPENNVTADVATFIWVYFNEEMNRTSVQQAFSARNETGFVNGTFSWGATSTWFMFRPSGPLDYNNTYRVTVTAAAKDVAGNNMGADATWEFMTENLVRDTFMEDNWWLVAIIFTLIFLIIAQFFQYRGLKMKMRRANVEIKKLRQKTADVRADSKTDAPVAQKETTGEDTLTSESDEVTIQEPKETSD